MERRFLQFPAPRSCRLATEPMPVLQPGELLLCTTRTLISTGTESIAYTRDFSADTHFDRWVRYPFCPGYLHCGVVEAVGPGVTGWRIGDRAATRGHHASHVAIAASQAVPVPPELTDEEAVWMGLGQITQVGLRAGAPQFGDTVVVVGLGLLGQLVARQALLAGARAVLALDPWAARLRFLAGLPATHGFAGEAAAAGAFVQSHAPGRADLVFDVTGHHAVFPAALGLARDFGTVVLLGDSGHPHRQNLTSDVITRGLRIVGAHDRHVRTQASATEPWTAPRMGALFLQYLAQRRMDVRPLITHRFSPDEAEAAYEFLQARRDTAMGCLFDWTPPA